MKLKKIVVPAVLILALALGGIYIICSTNFIFNHSCVGITYASNESALGTDLIVRYFESERAAKRLYEAEGLDAYCLAAVDADNRKGYRNTEEWFKELQAPLVYENEKFVQTSSLVEFAEQNELMQYGKGPGLDDGYIGQDELDKTVQLYHIGAEWMSVSDNCTDAEDDYLFRHCAFAFSLECDFDRYKLSVDQKDEYSMSFWKYQLADLCKNWELPEVPTTTREGIDWLEIDNNNSRYISVLKSKVDLLETGRSLESKDWDEINSATLSYTAAIIRLSRDLNSDAITEIKTDNIEVFTSESAVVEGTIARTNEAFPAYCLILDNETKIILKEIDFSQEYVCIKLYFYDDVEVNGGYDYTTLVGKKCSVTAQIEDYRGEGALFLCNPIITED